MLDKQLKCHEHTASQPTSLLPPPSEADQDGLSDVVEGGEEAGPAGEVEEPLKPRGGGEQPGAQRVDKEHADQAGHQPSDLDNNEKDKVISFNFTDRSGNFLRLWLCCYQSTDIRKIRKLFLNMKILTVFVNRFVSGSW